MEDKTKGVEDISDSSINKEISHGEMLASFLTDDDLHDVKIKGSDGVEVPANRFLLAARSTIFKAMFFGKFKEAKSPAIKLCFPSDVLRAVVEYIVTDSAEILNMRDSAEIGSEKKRKKRKSTKGTDETKPPYSFKNIELLVSLAEAASYFNLPELGKRVVALLEHLLLHWPCLSFAILQACRMAGPTIDSKLTDSAVRHVRALPFEKISTDQISCLSAEVLETVLKDEKMEITEYERFQILQQWTEAVGGFPSIQNERHARAASLSQHIMFERIDPIHLSTTVATSELVTSEKLSEVYKNQALAFASQAKSQAMFKANRMGTWSTTLPINEYPAQIKVEGAGIAAVNGVYEIDGSFDMACKYSMQGRYQGDPCVFSIYCADLYWYISNHEPHHSLPDDSFYFCSRSLEHDLPPCTEWEPSMPEGLPVPTMLYRVSIPLKFASDES
jgi:BTB/POZ domain